MRASTHPYGLGTVPKPTEVAINRTEQDDFSGTSNNERLRVAEQAAHGVTRSAETCCQVATEDHLSATPRDRSMTVAYLGHCFGAESP